MTKEGQPRIRRECGKRPFRANINAMRPIKPDNEGNVRDRRVQTAV